jgi:hypothetical protein
MTVDELTAWLLAGDVSIQYQTYRDLFGLEKPELQNRIENEGWGKLFLDHRNTNGQWGKSFYQPKWISTHYTLLDLKNLNISPKNKEITETLQLIFKNEKGPDGGILPIGTVKKSDVCVNGMVLNYASYFGVEENHLKSIIDFLLKEKMNDGGFNCHSNRKGAHHSSLHTTLSVLEGILEFEKQGYTYRIKELHTAKLESEEFILQHRLFKSDKTQEIINPNFLKFYYPCRWYYDILKALDYFQMSNAKFDERMSDALEVLIKKRVKEGTWKLPSKHPGLVHFEMEKSGMSSKWNTIRALRVLKHFNIQS